MTTERPNGPATIRIQGDRLTVSYRGRTLATGGLTVRGDVRFREATHVAPDGACTQVLAWSAEHVRLELHVAADEDAFSCEAEPDPYDRPPVVRHKMGRASNRLDRAIYLRSEDALLSIDHGPEVRIVPGTDHAFDLVADGSEVALRFRPRYYSRHRGFTSFEPWNRKPWREPVAGWCSWYAYWNRVTEEDVLATAEVLAARLRRYGLTVLQIDDGFQRAPVGLPETWTHANAKFPSGMAALAGRIRELGLTPGVWLTPMVHDESVATSHAKLFVRDVHGRPVRENWIGFPIDGSNPEALETFVAPTFRSFADDGWAYFKLDALRHLLFEGYNGHSGYFEERGADRSVAFRNVVSAVREAIGRDRFLLACWGVLPECAGLVDGARIGDDGFGWESLAQYNSLNNVVWRNDPDHIEATRTEGYRDCTITSLTGSVYMITDTPERLRESDLRAVRCTLPVPFTVPGQAYDVDPSRSAWLTRVGTEVSGAGPRPSDASRQTSVNLFQLDVVSATGDFTLLARIDDREPAIRFESLGLDPDAEFVVFEFWTQRLVGVFRTQFVPGPVDSGYGVQAFCIRRLQDHPFIVASDRNILCGAVDLSSIAWDGAVLSGRCERVPGDPCALFVYEPADFRCVGGVGSAIVQSGLRRLDLSATDEASTAWRLEYETR